MIWIENTAVSGFGAAIRGMRNPMNSWDRSDSHGCNAMIVEDCDCPMVEWGHDPAHECDNGKRGFCIGKRDLELMLKLAKAGTEHAKFMRYINVTVDLTAPLYWYKEMDCYRAGVEHNSCSTMHKIASRPFTLDDFSHEHIMHDRDSGTYVTDSKGDKTRILVRPIGLLLATVECLNNYRQLYLDTKDKKWWWQMIQLLPSSYNQRRTYQFSYQALAAIYRQRKGHKLDEWQTFREWIESLPYSEIITGQDNKKGEENNV